MLIAIKSHQLYTGTYWWPLIIINISFIPLLFIIILFIIILCAFQLIQPRLNVISQLIYLYINRQLLVYNFAIFPSSPIPPLTFRLFS